MSMGGEVVSQLNEAFEKLASGGVTREFLLDIIKILTNVQQHVDALSGKADVPSEVKKLAADFERFTEQKQLLNAVVDVLNKSTSPATLKGAIDLLLHVVKVAEESTNAGNKHRVAVGSFSSSSQGQKSGVSSGAAPAA